MMCFHWSLTFWEVINNYNMSILDYLKLKNYKICFSSKFDIFININRKHNFFDKKKRVKITRFRQL